MKFHPNMPASKHNPVSHGGLYSIKKPNSSILDFSSNTNPLGAAPQVKKYLKKQLKTVSDYPDSDSYELRKNLKWYTKVPIDQIVIGNGATEIIYNFCQAFINKKTPVLIPIPTFGEYEAAARLNGSKISFFKTMNLVESLEKFIQKIPYNGCIFICNPNNPTGKLVPKKMMMKILDTAKIRSTIVFVDECFIELASKPTESLVKILKKYENLFILRSFTKSFGLAGIRIGYGLGSKEIVSILSKIKIPWNVSEIAQKSASAALCYYKHLEKTNKLIPKETKFLRQSISKLKTFSCYDTSTNFILIKSSIKSKTLQTKLLAKKILIRDCSSFRGLNDNYIRIAVKKHKENKKLIKALEAI